MSSNNITFVGQTFTNAGSSQYTTAQQKFKQDLQNTANTQLSTDCNTYQTDNTNFLNDLQSNNSDAYNALVTLRQDQLNGAGKQQVQTDLSAFQNLLTSSQKSEYQTVKLDNKTIANDLKTSDSQTQADFKTMQSSRNHALLSALGSGAISTNNSINFAGQTYQAGDFQYTAAQQQFTTDLQNPNNTQLSTDYNTYQTDQQNMLTDLQANNPNAYNAYVTIKNDQVNQVGQTQIQSDISAFKTLLSTSQASAYQQVQTDYSTFASDLKGTDTQTQSDYHTMMIDKLGALQQAATKGTISNLSSSSSSNTTNDTTDTAATTTSTNSTLNPVSVSNSTASTPLASTGIVGTPTTTSPITTQANTASLISQISNLMSSLNGSSASTGSNASTATGASNSALLTSTSSAPASTTQLANQINNLVSSFSNNSGYFGSNNASSSGGYYSGYNSSYNLPSNIYNATFLG